MKKTKIICTVGPSTDNIPLLVSMLKAGMDMARLIFHMEAILNMPKDWGLSERRLNKSINRSL